MVNQKQLAPETILEGRYRIVKRIGGGGMGSVYLAYDQKFGPANDKTRRAVKEMYDLFTDPAQRQKAIEDFQREGQLLASLEHPSIPTVYDYFVNDGKYYLVMKYVPGDDLAKKLKSSELGYIDERTVTEWAIQVCDVLDYIHNQNPPVIYRDLKPANLMLDETRTPPRVMLIDFGIARFVAPTQKGVTAIGTMGYAPPELFSGQVEPRSDLYSLGATMFHLLTGADPQDNPLLIFDFSKNPRPRAINPKLTTGIEAIVMQAVAHRPQDRPASAAEMKRMLEEHLRHLDSPPMPSLEPIFCIACGGSLAPDDAFCPHCGAPQPQAQGASGRKAASNRQVACLQVLDAHGNPKAAYELSKSTMLLGRTDPHTGNFPEIDLTPHDAETKVSRRHARLFQEGGRFFIEDLSSVNGTFLNGNVRLIPKTPHPLQNGDELKLGETRVRFTIQ
ncbi:MULTISPECIES: FHA domain-containing serine/threonine-protein kinase [Chloracidobacterium]|jgi:serine/threonine protein kinase|uniref:Serine/threonine protein kinase n=1 Tax=Chloracidobacterium thermophilum (strain B) TaxID=981222 RepID=G2LDS5_CHLTF|nr:MULTISPECIES: FHA domain-containing serine/threonine-protein kinase [Chloracidobacterium]AEP12933.1 Serine/threonine protein kinase [Chloracidobacterium thermophilum B]QUV78652.1 protein kinase [Chloracidobacterium thermophilum]QUV81696.1 protein kinase [Chloracidobacterium sp. D]